MTAALKDRVMSPFAKGSASRVTNKSMHDDFDDGARATLPLSLGCHRNPYFLYSIPFHIRQPLHALCILSLARRLGLRRPQRALFWAGNEH